MPDPKTFNEQPPADTRYRSAIDRAKARAQVTAPPLEGTPRFDELPKGAPPSGFPGGPTPKKHLSSETAAGLDALGRAQQAQRPSTPPAAPAPSILEEEEEGEEEGDGTDDEAGTETELSRYKNMRRAVEARCAPIDLYQYLSTGSAIQDVPIIGNGQYTVRFRTASEYEEGWVDKQLALASKNPMSQRQVQRLLNELGLAAAIMSINGQNTGFPLAVKPDGSVDEEAMQVRVASVRRLSSPIFTLLVLNLGWFVERVNTALSVECLKNG